MPESIGNKIAAIDILALPKNKTETRNLQNYFAKATDSVPLTIYVGSCPDYSHSNGLYNHKSLGEDVPLLTCYHLQYADTLFKIFEETGIPFRYIIMIADVEATDDVFCSRFTGGSEEEFLRRCYVSMSKTQAVLSGTFPRLRYGKVVSSSFFQEFSRRRFLQTQSSYQHVLNLYYENNSSFALRVQGDVIGRMPMYQRMYQDVLANLPYCEQSGFLVDRTIRTMAQYLTLGRLAGETSRYPIIINHPTRNFSMINQRNKYKLPEDGVQPQPTIPILEMRKEVY